MSYQSLPGQIKHGILQSLQAAPQTVGEIAATLKAQNRKFAIEWLRKKHIRELAADYLVEINDGVVSMTADGHARLRVLDTKKNGSPPGPKTPPKRTNIMTGVYDGAELRQNVGIPDERYEAFKLPSIFMGYRTWPDGRSEKLDDLGR